MRIAVTARVSSVSMLVYVRSYRVYVPGDEAFRGRNTLVWWVDW